MDFLKGIENLDNEMEIGTKKADNEDLSWLVAGSKESNSFLSDIEKIEVADIHPLLKTFIAQGIVGIVERKSQNRQLNQPELRLLQEFNRTFPFITEEELEEAANVLK